MITTQKSDIDRLDRVLTGASRIRSQSSSRSLPHVLATARRHRDAEREEGCANQEALRLFTEKEQRLRWNNPKQKDAPACRIVRDEAA